MEPASLQHEDLLSFGWEIAAATLAGADSERRLVTHWFRTPADSAPGADPGDGVNADEHFGSDERTLRFLGVALPTLIDQLSASAAVVVLPWGVDRELSADPGPPPSGQTVTSTLTVVSVIAGGRAGDTRAEKGRRDGENPDGASELADARHASRTLIRLRGESGPPFWRLEPGPTPTPAQLASTVARLAT